MSKEQLMQRMLAAWGKVIFSRLRRPSLAGLSMTGRICTRLRDAARAR